MLLPQKTKRVIVVEKREIKENGNNLLGKKKRKTEQQTVNREGENRQIDVRQFVSCRCLQEERNRIRIKPLFESSNLAATDLSCLNR